MFIQYEHISTLSYLIKELCIAIFIRTITLGTYENKKSFYRFNEIIISREETYTFGAI